MSAWSIRLALAVLLFWLLCALAASQLALAPDTINLAEILAPPGLQHWLGTDELGRSIAARVLEGAQVSCGVGIAVTMLSLLVGVGLGVPAALAGGVLDGLAARLIDVFMAFPGILLAIALAGVLGPGPGNVVLALCAVSWVGFARLARAQTLSVKTRDHVLAARALGSRRWFTITRHVLPLIAPPLLVEASFTLAGAVVAEAGLSFLGLGAQPPAASWGSMIRQAMQFLLVAPHLLLGPCLALLSLVLCANLLGDHLRDALQPTRGMEGAP